MGEESDWKELAALVDRTWRGGKHAYYWFLSGDQTTKHSQWVDPNDPECPKPIYQDFHQYFGVHPTSTRRSGRERSTKESIAAINCLFGDFDAKGEVLPDEYAPFLPDDMGELSKAEQKGAIKKAQEEALPCNLAIYKARALAKVKQCPLRPSWIVDSGGGYQCYWFLKETVQVTDQNRERLALLQKEWVRLIEADPGAAALNQVLRIPGSRNVKAYFAPNPPQVRGIEADEGCGYELAQFEELTGVDEVFIEAEKAQRPHRVNPDPVIATFNQTIKIGDILTRHGYQLGRTHPGIERYSRPGREKYQTSVVVWTEENRSYHHSSSDPLYTNGHSRDCFDAFTRLDHNGDTTAAYIDAKKQQGLWEEEVNDQAEPEADEAAEEEPGTESQGETKKAKKRVGPTTAILAALAKLGYTFRFNLIKERIEYEDGTPLHDGEEATIITRLFEIGFKNKGLIRDVILTQAWGNCFDPLRSFLESLTWDGDDHIRLLSYYFTDAHSIIEYEDGRKETVIHAWMRRWLIGAVAKVLNTVQNPMLVLASEEQGVGKSEFAKWLCSPLPSYFVESFLNPESVEHQRLATESFIWEVGELGATTRKSDVEALKSFITRHDHSYRAPYARNGVTKPARASFIGTVNKDNAGFLTDATGSRRFLIVEITAINWKGYVADIDPCQVWAQAYALYCQDPSAWQLDEAELARRIEINQDFEVEDPVQEAILYFYAITPKANPEKETPFLSTADITLQVAIRVKTTSTKVLQMDVARAMRKLGVTKGYNSASVRGYYGVQLKSKAE